MYYPAYQQGSHRDCRIRPSTSQSYSGGKPESRNGEDYQKGEMYGSYNVCQYVLWRDNYTCICCGVRGTPNNPVRLHVHHFESRKYGGNAPDNHRTLCDDCHKKFHLGIITDVKLKTRRRQSTRDAAFMGIMRKTLMWRLRTELFIPVAETKGYITKATAKSCWYFRRATPVMLWQLHRVDTALVLRSTPM